MADKLFSFVITATAPVLQRFAKSRGKLPAASAAADQAGISILSRHYYSPAISESDLYRPLNIARRLPGVDLDLERHKEFLSHLVFADELLAIPMIPPSKTEFGYSNSFFDIGDAEIFYGIIRTTKPRRTVEVGSGWSTLMARKAIARNQQDDPSYHCDHICIEPYEAPWLESTGVTVLRERVELMDPAVFDQLEAGDILFVDSSHTIRPQGDVLFEIFEIYPRLKPGVLVQIHDIFTPRDYHHRWVIDDRRIWGEQYLLEAFLNNNAGYEIVCALNWLSNDHRDLLTQACPVLCKVGVKQPGSFWMRRTAN